MDVRPAVKTFAEAMEEVLQSNDHKCGGGGMTIAIWYILSENCLRNIQNTKEPETTQMGWLTLN